MPSTTLFDMTGAKKGTVDLPDSLFAVEVNEAVIHQAVTAQLNARRTGTASTKTRAQVSGGGAKPYRQKGTGRARQGSRRAPHYAGGGVVFGPHTRSYAQRLPRRMKRLALHGALTAKYGDGAIRVVDQLGFEQPRTRDLLTCLEALSANGRVLVVAPADVNLELSARNLPAVEVIRPDSLNVVDVLNADTLLITQPSLSTLAEVYS